VVEDYRVDPGHAPIPHRHLEESRVLGLAEKQGPAMKPLVQVMYFLLIFCQLSNGLCQTLTSCNFYSIDATDAKSLLQLTVTDRTGMVGAIVP